MKKTLMVFLAIALVSSFAFAEVTGVEAPTVSGSITTTFGYSLDNESSGFKNSSDVNVVVPLAAGDDTHAGSGSVYAEITIEDIDISLATDSDDWDEGAEVSFDADVSAKIVAGALYVGLGNPDLDFNNVDLDKDLQIDADDDDADIDVNADVAGDDGISIGYITDAFSFEFGIASKKDAYEDDDTALFALEDDTTDWLDSNETDEIDDGAVESNSSNEYVIGVNASIMAGPLTLPVYFAYDFTYASPDALMGIGAAPSVAAGDLTLDIPFDYVSVGSDYGFETKPVLGYAIAGVGTIAADFLYTKYDIAALPAITNIMEAGLVFTEDFNDALALVVDFDLTGLGEDAAEMGWNVNVDLSYDMGAVAPYVTVDYGDNEDLDLSVGAVLATAIDNATITLDYTNDHVLDGATAGSALKGVVTVAIDVAY